MTKTSIDQKIARLEAELKTAKAAKTKNGRQERNSQLMSFGIMLETKYKTLPEAERAKIRGWMTGLDDRNRARVEAGFTRLDSMQSSDGDSYSSPRQSSA